MDSIVIVYTADEEEPNCARCCHFGDNFDCAQYCGSEHSWFGYIRKELVEVKI